MNYSFDDDDFLKREADFARIHQNDSDEQLLQLVYNRAIELGRNPNKHDVEGFVYLKSRLGPWPVILERAGLKDVGRRRSSIEKNGDNEKQLLRQNGMAKQRAEQAKKVEKMLFKKKVGKSSRLVINNYK